MNPNPRLKFRNEVYILVNGESNKKEGAIATEEQYDNFEESFAHLFEDGRIMRYGEVIGNIEDVEWLD